MPLSLLDRLFGRNERSAQAVAKDRLRLVLMNDHAGISGPMLEEMRLEILAVIAKYVEIDKQLLDVSVERADETVALIANIPIRQIYPHKKHRDNSAGT